MFYNAFNHQGDAVIDSRVSAEEPAESGAGSDAPCQDLDATLRGSVESERMLRAPDVAEILDVRLVPLRRWIRSGEPKAARMRGYRVHPVDLSPFPWERGIGR
jgi:hypothetical protein